MHVVYIIWNILFQYEIKLYYRHYKDIKATRLSKHERSPL